MTYPLKKDIPNPTHRSSGPSYPEHEPEDRLMQVVGNQSHSSELLPGKRRRIPAEKAVQNITADGHPSAIKLSPEESSIYSRRQGSRGSRLPILQSPKRRRIEPVPRARSPRPRAPSPLDQPFNIFQALLKNPELTFEFSKQLEVDDLVALYAISKDFHYLANRRFTAMILGQSMTKAPESSRTFTFTCYRSLCLADPNRTQLSGMNGMIRTIPSFRWLKMVLFRERMVDEIMAHLYEHGHRLPQRTSLVVKKLWFTLDFSDNVRRVGLVHNEEYWSSKDLFLAMMFFVKLDMRLNDPLTGSGHIALRRMLLNQRSLSTLAKVLRREEMKRDIDMVRMMVLYDYAPTPNSTQSILGIEAKYVGKLQYEGWGERRTKFIPIDELIARESLKRGLQMHHYYIDMMIYGYIDKRTFQDVQNPPPGTFAGQDYSMKRDARRSQGVALGARSLPKGDEADASAFHAAKSLDEVWGDGSDESSDSQAAYSSEAESSREGSENDMP